MTTAIIISLCSLLLIAYLFDITAGKTRIPAVILLLALGLTVQYVLRWLHISLRDLTVALPVLGTIGLILIVLEGALELEVAPEKVAVVKKATYLAALPMLLLVFAGAALLFAIGQGSFRNLVINMVPLAVISSAVAIPTARALSREHNEFVVYESSLSDILGVVFFNFVVTNEVINGWAFLHFGGQLVIMVLVSLVATIGLALLLRKIDHHVKFIPIVLLIVLIYALGKVYHLPGLIFILLLGLFLGNVGKLSGISIFSRLDPRALKVQVHKFGELVTELTFLTRASFFLLFGYTINVSELVDTGSLSVALGLVVAIFAIRALFLRMFRLSVFPLLFIAPRGLITVLLFLSIPATAVVPVISRGLVIQVVVITALIMMVGTMLAGRRHQNDVMPS
ncbi:MAG: sodium:proton antiporter [Chitinophagaceae bacterium]|nr:sodium:proton antiporter [Chitinophagaceae bacterium]